MSIRSEIDRLKTAKSGLATAIIGKGVTVPDGTLLSEYPALIDQIQASGGEPEPPDDGKTRLYIHVPENAMEGLPPPRADASLYISQTVSGGVSIDWGDDSEPDTISGTGNVKTTHHYTAGGDYVITLAPSEGCELGLGWGLSSYCVMGRTFNTGIVYCNMLQKAVIGIGATNIDSYAFYNCYGLASVVISDGVTSIGNTAFYNCYGVKECHILATTPPSIQSSTFGNIPYGCIIYVPAGTVDAYKTATNWAELADKIQEEPA